MVNLLKWLRYYGLKEKGTPLLRESQLTTSSID